MSVVRVLGSPVLPVVQRRCHRCNAVHALAWDASFYCSCGAHNDPRTGSNGAWSKMHQEDAQIREISRLIGQVLRYEWKLTESLAEITSQEEGRRA